MKGWSPPSKGITGPPWNPEAHPAFDASFLIDPNLIIGPNILHDLYPQKLQIL